MRMSRNSKSRFVGARGPVSSGELTLIDLPRAEADGRPLCAYGRDNRIHYLQGEPGTVLN